MRVNVYSEELTGEVHVVHKLADTGEHYYGCRLYLESPTTLHATDLDDDRSAVTVWFADVAIADKVAQTLGLVIISHRESGNA
jgi:hypothetical protein